MFNILKRMIENGEYTKEYIDERIEVFYLVGKLTKDEYLDLKNILDNKSI